MVSTEFLEKCVVLKADRIKCRHWFINFHMSNDEDKLVPVYDVKVCGGGVEAELHSFLTSALDGREWSTSRSESFMPGKKKQGYTLNGRPGGLQNSSGRLGDEKTSC